MYIYYLSNLSYMFRRIMHHPQGALLSFAENYLLILMLRWLQSVRNITCEFYNVIYND
jgi:hypothetical protein